MILELIRLETSFEEGTFGILRINKKIFCSTLEPPDKFNSVGKSCIPTGTYTVEPVKSPKFGETWKVCNVPGRSHILLHKGNLVEHTAGCVLLGSSQGKLRDERRGVVNSGTTFRRFMKVMSEPATLTVTECL